MTYKEKKLEEFDNKFWWKHQSCPPEDSNKFSASECKILKDFLSQTIDDLIAEVRLEKISHEFGDDPDYEPPDYDEGYVAGYNKAVNHIDIFKKNL